MHTRNMSQLPTTYLAQIKEKTLAYQTVRRDVIKQSGDALHHAKKAIFAMHRGDLTIANTYLAEAEREIQTLVKENKKTSAILSEGAFQAAIEEIVEATLFSHFLRGKKLQKITTIPVSDDVFVAGLADVPGELYRYALKMGTAHNLTEVLRAQALADEIVESLIQFDLTKHLRNKFDQAKGALHKIEQVVYELSVS